MLLICLMLCDIFTLKSGGKIDGVERSRKDGKVMIEVAAGMVTVDEKEIAEVKPAPSKVADYYERAGKLKESKNVPALMGLASWAKESGVSRFALQLYERILAIDPKHELAHRGLGHERVGEKWMTHDDAMAARGNVQFEGRWVVPEERDLILAARAAARPKKVERRADVVVVERRVEEETLYVGAQYGWRPRRGHGYYDGCYPWYYDYQFWRVRVAPGTVIAPTFKSFDYSSIYSGGSGYSSRSFGSAPAWGYPNYQIYEKK